MSVVLNRLKFPIDLSLGCNQKEELGSINLGLKS
jgi:hypothetical protein